MHASLHNLCITLLLASAALAAASPATAAVYEARSVLEAAREQNDASGGLEHLLGWLEGNSPLTATLETITGKSIVTQDWSGDICVDRLNIDGVLVAPSGGP